MFFVNNSYRMDTSPQSYFRIVRVRRSLYEVCCSIPLLLPLHVCFRGSLRDCRKFLSYSAYDYITEHFLPVRN